MLSTIIEPYVGDVKSVLMARCWLAVFYIVVAIVFVLWYTIRQKISILYLIINQKRC